MVQRAAPRCLEDDLVEQPATRMAAVTNAARNAAEPGFKSNTQRIWEENGGVKAGSPSERAGGRKEGIPLERKNHVHFRNQSPQRCDLRRRSDRNARIRAPILERADCRHAHYSVAEPVA